MRQASKTTIEWTYEPREFFEEEIALNFSGGLIAISQGKAPGEFDASRYDEGDVFRTEAHNFVESAFLAQQVQNHLAFTLAQPAIAREHADGRRDVSIFVNSVVMVMTVGTLDIVVRDASGKVTADSKAERLEKQSQFRTDVNRISPTDVALRRMLQSFRNAIRDSDNMLIHLYEIRETLVTEFSGEKYARQSVNVSSTDWRKFGRLANNEPLLEGRHRGKHAALSKITPEEAAWALNFSQRLMEGYVQARR